MLKHKIYQAMLAKDQSINKIKLEDKKMPLITINQHQNIVKFIKAGQGDQPSAAITNLPLSLHSCLVYFQAQIINCKRDSDIAIGLTNKDAALKKHPGQSKFSVGYKSSGEIYFHRSKMGTSLTYNKKDRIGVGVDYIQKQIFFTKNGCIQTLTVKGYDDIGWSKFYPCVSLHSEGDQVQLIFDENKFMFKLDAHKAASQLKVYNTIDKQECNYEQIYQLVADYLAFNGYTQTYNMLKQDQGQIFKQGKFVKNPFLQNKLTNNKISSSDDVANKVQVPGQVDNGNSDDQIQVPQQFKRQRIMSDYWGYMNQDQPVRKYTAGQQKVFDNLRKSSVISNDGSMINIIQHSEQDHEQMMQQEFLNKYLKSTRIKIIELIRQQKLQEAENILRNTLPEIFNFDTNLEVYFKIHIYLRKVKRQSALAAIQYIRQIKDLVLKFSNEQFLKFSKRQCKMVKTNFQDIIGSLRYEHNTNYDTLCYQQFQGFSQYVNEVILTGLGFQCESRLDMIINHLHKIQNKTVKYQLAGPIFKFDSIQ